MPVPRDEVTDIRPLSFREPADVLDTEYLYTVYEIARLLQGIDPETQLDIETENVLLDWAIPWILYNADSFVFAEPAAENEPGYYGLATK